MPAEHVTESDFLLRELRYALTQMRIQAERVARDNPARADTLRAAVVRERRYLKRYASLLGGDAEDEGVGSEEVEGDGVELEALCRARETTLRLLDTSSRPWPDGVADVVMDQLREDRASATALADLQGGPND